ncbi:hypothetical protein T265_11389 [Opisthorchis viverrini]|uniref:C-type lectin domain-containing protein n=1 Tax=Opisthorchis viverrini TaxID=6198 RepID=A0A074Z356_OPIVI|nr:hypothetical protein T265_11389 [Opisthorchis viverrini]KER19957.1 hypothetical protein T265_11389 [Opisthorchis viverrini]
MFRRIHIILVLLPTATRALCPPDYTRLSADVCTIQLNESRHFCDACNLCSNYGKQHNQLVFLHGRNVNLVKTILQPGSRAWNGMHGFLGIPEFKSVAGWRDLDPKTPEITSAPDLFKWAVNQPDGNQPNLAYHKKYDAMYDIHSGPANYVREVHCECALDSTCRSIY